MITKMSERMLWQPTDDHDSCLWVYISLDEATGAREEMVGCLDRAIAN